MVLENYTELRFCRLKKGSKVPFEKDWQNKPYTMAEIKPFLDSGLEQYGVLAGFGGLIIIDTDNPLLQAEVESKLPLTHRVQTGGGGVHNYFFCSEIDKKIIFRKGGVHYGELLTKGFQAVGNGALHPNGNYYKSLDENPIVQIRKQQILDALSDFIPQNADNITETPLQEPLSPLIEKIIPYWNKGDRQNLALALSGHLRKEGSGIAKVKNIIHSICKRTGDSEISMRLACVDSTFQKDESDILGFSGLPQEFKEAITQEELKQNPPVEAGSYEVMTFKDFKKLKKDKSHIVENFLYPSTITMLYSPPASFKSLIATGFSFAIANGKSFLNLKTKKSPVLYLDGENSLHNSKERYEQIHKGLNLVRQEFPFYVLKNGLFMDAKKKLDLGFMASLEGIIQEKGIKVLMIDTLHRFAFYDENKSDDLNLLYVQIFKPLIQKYKIAILFLHHSTKNGGYRGSGDFLGLVDVSYSVIRKAHTNEFRIINEKCRSGEIADINGEILFEQDEIRFIRQQEQTEEKKTLNKLKEVTAKIRDMIKPETPLKRVDIIANFDMIDYDYGSTRTIDRALKWLLDNMILDKDAKGVYSTIR